jgi:hypothetical protein
LAQIINFAAQHEQLQSLVKFSTTFMGQIAETSAKLVNLLLSYIDLIAVMAFVDQLASSFSKQADGLDVIFDSQFNVSS